MFCTCKSCLNCVICSSAVSYLRLYFCSEFKFYYLEMSVRLWFDLTHTEIKHMLWQQIVTLFPGPEYFYDKKSKFEKSINDIDHYSFYKMFKKIKYKIKKQLWRYLMYYLTFQIYSLKNINFHDKSLTHKVHSLSLFFQNVHVVISQ